MAEKLAADDQIIAALAEQVKCYRLLAKLTELQHVHVQQGQTEQLLEVLKSRQQVLDEAVKQEQLVGPAKRQWADFVGRLDDARRQVAEKHLGETRKLLGQITAADKNDSLALQQRKINLGRQIGKTTVGRQVNRKYAAAAYGKPTSQMDIRR